MPQRLTVGRLAEPFGTKCLGCGDAISIKQVRESSFDIRATSRMNRLYVRTARRAVMTMAPKHHPPPVSRQRRGPRG